MYGLPIVSPDITVYVSAICVTRMETRINRTRFLSKHKRIILSMIKHEKLGVAGQQRSTRYGVSDLVHTQKSIIELNGVESILYHAIHIGTGTCTCSLVPRPHPQGGKGP